MANNNPRPGDAVELFHQKAGAPETPEMLLLRVRGGKALCTWDDDHGSFHRTAWFRLRCLRVTSR